MSTITDDFNRADEDPILSPWSNVGRGALSLLSHVIEGFNTATSGDHCARHTTAIGSDQYSQVRIKTIDTGGACNGVSVRCSNSQNTYYGLLVSNTDWFLTKVVNDANPVVLATGSVTPSVNDIIYLSATGTSTTILTAKLNTTTLGTYSDNSTPITSGYVGMAQSGDTGARSQDLFQGGDIGGGGGGSIYPQIVMMRPTGKFHMVQVD